MAEYTRLTGSNKPKYVGPPGYEVVDKGKATEIIEAGTVCVLGASGWSIAATSAKAGMGIALLDYVADQEDAEFLIQGEMEGYSTMTPGTPLYPSATTAGDLTDTAPVYYTSATTPVVNVPAVPQIRAVTANRIRVNFV